jgi:hypothetical protein
MGVLMSNSTYGLSKWIRLGEVSRKREECTSIVQPQLIDAMQKCGFIFATHSIFKRRQKSVCFDIFLIFHISLLFTHSFGMPFMLISLDTSFVPEAPKVLSSAK